MKRRFLILCVVLLTVPVFASPVGDLNEDWTVDLADLVIFAEDWLTFPGCPVGEPTCTDLIGGDRVDMTDFALFMENWFLTETPTLVINEFMASNDTTIADSYGEYDDWIEIYNYGTQNINMAGMQLRDSDNTYTIPDDPNALIAPSEYKLFWADNDKLPDQGPLHTNFKLGASGDDIYLFNKNGILIDSKTYNADQVADISHGRFPDKDIDWYNMDDPTPGAANTAGMAGDVWFSKLSGTFTSTFNLQLFTETPGATIRYTTDGSAPTAGSTAYSGPISITNAAARRIRARAYHATLAPGHITSHYYIPLASDVQTFSSNLPIVVIDTYNTPVDLGVLKMASSVFVDTDKDTGIASIQDVPDHAGRIGLKRRGESSDAWPKKHYGMELWDEHDMDTKAPILGMPSESDWILNNPYGDKTLMRNVLAFKWSNDIGEGFAAPGTKFIEVFVNDGGGNCSYDDYRGVYVLTEKIKVSENRLDIGKLTSTDNTEPEITGGYIVRLDKDYGGIYEEFETSPKIISNSDGQGFQYYDPDQYTATNAQKTWIQNHFQAFQDVLTGPDFDDPIIGYANYIDVEAFIESDLIAELFKEADGFRYSTYLYKEKNGKIAFGPQWDFNFSSGNASISTPWSYPDWFAKAVTDDEGWYNDDINGYGWHNRLMLDSDYQLRTADKWFEHREDKLSDAQVTADIDDFYNLLDADGPTVDTGSTPADRNFTKWNILNNYEWCNYYYGYNSSAAEQGNLPHTYKMEIEWLKNWFNGQGTPAPGESYIATHSDRLGNLDDLWLSDRNIAAPPTLWINGSPMNTGGTITAGSTLTMTGSAGTIYYTTDGVDPRVFKGSGTINNIILVAESDAKKVLVPTSEVTGSSSTGSILREYWTGISGTSVSNLTSNSNFPNVPTGSDLLTTFEAPIDWADDYGTRIRGYLHPPTTKNYTFWVSGDDETQLWLSTDANPSNATQIAYVPDWTSSREWDKHGSQQSDLITLAAGQQYYIEVLHKEGNGGDNIAVAWDESGSLEIIDGAYLSQEGGQVWAGEGFDDSSWTSGSGGVGYEDSPSDTINFTALIDTDVQSAMSGVNPTCYIRIPFTVTGDPALFTSLSLNVRYDDGFIAYINGSEIKRVNADPGEPAWNSSASTYRSSDSLALDLESFDISGSIGTLKSGANVLAIQGLNSSAGSSDFLISASLTGSQDVAGTVYANAIEYTGDVTLNETTQIKARVKNGSDWTALNEAIFSDSRLASSLRITEVMYHPVDPNDEFIEFTNIGASTVNLAHCRLTKGVDFTFPDYDLAPNDHVLVVRNLAAFSLLHPTLVSSIAGEYTNDKLDNGGETIRLKDAAGVIIQEFEYEDGWFPITDGLSYSLNIINPNDPVLDNWNKRLSWEASNVAGGTPGADHTNNAVGNEDIVINEILTHTDDSEGDWIELYNTTGSSIDVGGWYLSDDKDNLKKYKIASPTNISGGGYLVLTATTHFQNASNPGSAVTFGLSEHGESVFLTSGNGSDIAGGYSDGESFGSSKNDVTFGRYTKGAPTYNTDFIELTSMTQGASNSAPYVPDVVISEILYNAQGIEDQLGEYIELYNRSGSTVYLYDTANPSNTWRLTKGAEFQFPTGITMASDARILISRAHPEAFRTANGLGGGVTIYGPFTSGTELANDGEKIELSMPTDPDPGTGFISYIRVEQVNYSDGIHPLIGDPWPTSADGRGDSLHRTTLSDYANDVANWSAAAPTPGS